jgi:uncharacterized membrane protein
MTVKNESTGKPTVNLSQNERTASAIAGSLLLYYAVKKHRPGALLALAGGYLAYRGLSGHCTLRALNNERILPLGHNINVQTHVIVNRPRQEVFAFWRKLENLNLFMEHVTIRELDDKRSSWSAKIPSGKHLLQWEAEIVKEEEGKEISWKSLPGSAVYNIGKISFSDTPGKATRIDAFISYQAPFGPVGEGLSRLLTPLFSHKIREDIRNFKYFVEDNA